MSTIHELIELLQVEQLELNLFRGVSGDIGSRHVFGGQVLGQSLMAALRTVDPTRQAHSLHAYFLRPGDKRAPIVYDVDRIRDGTSFTTRRVVAIQHGRPIFNMSASFQVREEGSSHQDPMPQVPQPEGLLTEAEHRERYMPRVPEHLRDAYQRDRPIEIRPITVIDPLEPGVLPPVFDTWLKAQSCLPDVPGLHQAMLAYASDFYLLSAALLPHDMSFFDPELHIASLDHAMWFHRDFRMDEWLLYATESPSASGARGLSRGKFYTRDGRLVASTVQEGLVRRTRRGA